MPQNVLQQLKWHSSPSLTARHLTHDYAAEQEADEVAAQVVGLKEQLGSSKVDQLVEDYPR